MDSKIFLIWVGLMEQKDKIHAVPEDGSDQNKAVNVFFS